MAKVSINGGVCGKSDELPADVAIVCYKSTIWALKRLEWASELIEVITMTGKMSCDHMDPALRLIELECTVVLFDPDKRNDDEGCKTSKKFIIHCTAQEIRRDLTQEICNDVGGMVFRRIHILSSRLDKLRPIADLLLSKKIISLSASRQF